MWWCVLKGTILEKVISFIHTYNIRRADDATSLFYLHIPTGSGMDVIIVYIPTRITEVLPSKDLLRAGLIKSGSVIWWWWVLCFCAPMEIPFRAAAEENISHSHQEELLLRRRTII